MWITRNYGKFFTLSVCWETCTQIKKQQLELDVEQQTGSKLGKEYVKAVFHHPAYLTEMPGCMTHRLE